MKQPIDQFSTALPAEKRASVYQSTKGTHEKRTKLLFGEFADPNQLRATAAAIKQHVLEHLDTYLPAVEAKLQANGAQVHWAASADAAPPWINRGRNARPNRAFPFLVAYFQLIRRGGTSRNLRRGP